MKFKRIEKIILSLLLTLCIFATICFVWKHINCILNADDSTELVLSNILSRNHEVITKNWFYGNEIKLLSFNQIASILFSFINDWHIVRVLTGIILYVLIIFSLFFLLKIIERTNILIPSLILIFLPMSQTYCDYFLFKYHYIIFFVLTTLFFAIYFSIKNIKSFNFCILLLISFFLGLSGIRYSYNIFIPIFIVFVFDVLNELLLKRMCVFSLKKMIIPISVFTYAVGLLINLSVFTKIFHYSNRANLTFSNFNILLSNEIINDFFSFFGWQNGSVKQCIFNCLFSLAFTFLLFYTVSKNIKYKFVKDEKIIFFIKYFLCSLLLFIFANFIFNNSQFRGRYFMPFIIFSIPLVFIILSDIPFPIWLKKMILYSIIILSLVNAFTNYLKYYNIDRNSDLIDIKNFLLDNGLYEGYGTYWNTGVLTELSDGKIDVWGLSEINDLSIQNFKFNYCLQSYEHLKRKPGEINLSKQPFLLLTNEELKKKYGIVSDSKFLYMNNKYCLYLLDTSFNKYE